MSEKYSVLVRVSIAVTRHNGKSNLVRKGSFQYTTLIIERRKELKADTERPWRNAAY